MLRGRWVPLLENKTSFLVYWLLGFLFFRFLAFWFLGVWASSILGFLVSSFLIFGFLGFKVSKIQSFQKAFLMFGWKILILCYHISISCFLEDIDPIFEISRKK